MVDYRQRHTAHWLQHFAARGYPTARPLAAGVEGSVYRLGEGVVAKVWSGRPPADLDLTRQVYRDIARHQLSFATPEILDVEEFQGIPVSYERELPGAPLGRDSAFSPQERDLSSRTTNAILTVLRGLSTVNRSGFGGGR